MSHERKLLLQQFFNIAITLLITICLVRVYEYVAIAAKVFVGHPWSFELLGLGYDVWLWAQYSFVFFLVFFLLWKLHRKMAVVVFHTSNVLFLLCYISLLITFSERTTPFDHEFFTRNSADSWTTVKQMLTSGVKVYLPLLLYVGLYFLIYRSFGRKLNPAPKVYAVYGLVSVLSLLFVGYSNPSADWFEQKSSYYLTSNKFSYWLHDSYHYLTHKQQAQLTDRQLLSEIAFYQQNQPFQFTSTEYPLLHKNDARDVLGPFFNLGPTLPNIVILVIEGLSKDFTGSTAYAGSFTPFLDSLSQHSLTWDNFLSTAPGTFASQPAISSSVPYGKKGFSIMNVMPDHLSLIKIAKRNGYFTNFMTGFNMDFDNMGGYIRLQGTDFILSQYPAKYKKMGVGEEGWSMGYPDDALYQRSFEVLDSIGKKTYFNIYHTGTTHMPYLFEQKPLYEKLFDQKLKTMKVSATIKQTLRSTKSVLTTFMFSDDCIKKFFADYARRSEYNNTIFLIIGDHHIGSFPSTGPIDDYHIPLIIYSPMLKKAQKFLSVNSHNNIAPTISALLQHNYRLQWQPDQVHWLGDVLDTATQFRNIHSMAFMSWSREINDYLYKDYFLSDDQLYKLTPTLLLQPYKNDTLKEKMIRLRENFKAVNDYVCEKNKVYPADQNFFPGKKELVWSYNDSVAKTIYRNASDTGLAPMFNVPKGYKYLYVETTADVSLPYEDPHPTLRFAIIDDKNWQKKYLFWSKHDVIALFKGAFTPKEWLPISSNDMFMLDDYKSIKDLKFEVAIYTDSLPINLPMRKLMINVYGVK